MILFRAGELTEKTNQERKWLIDLLEVSEMENIEMVVNQLNGLFLGALG